MPLRENISTFPPSMRLKVRYPSNFTSCSQSSPAGACCTSVARAGFTKRGMRATARAPGTVEGSRTDSSPRGTSVRRSAGASPRRTPACPAAAISSRLRPLATERSNARTACPSPSTASSSRCLISSQFVLVLLPRSRSHAHQHPAASKLLAVQSELEIALPQSLVRIARGLPVSAVPQQHRPGAVLSLGNGPLEAAVLQRMVLHASGKTLVSGVERRTFGDRPGEQHPIPFQPEVVVQAGGVGLLHDEEKAACVCTRGRVGARLAGYLARRPGLGRARADRLRRLCRSRVSSGTPPAPRPSPPSWSWCERRIAPRLQASPTPRSGRRRPHRRHHRERPVSPPCASAPCCASAAP